MEIGQLDNKTTEWLKLVKERIEIPENVLSLKYWSDVDLLVVRFANGKSTYSKDDMKKGVVYNYDANDNLVSIEVLDLYGVFV